MDVIDFKLRSIRNETFNSKSRVDRRHNSGNCWAGPILGSVSRFVTLVLRSRVCKAQPTWGKSFRYPGAAGGRFLTTGISLKQFLSQLLNRSVIDRTGLKGMYDIRFEWTPDLRPSLPVDAASALEPSGPSLFTAIQEQVGLKLVSAKGLVEMIVVDAAVKPERR